MQKEERGGLIILGWPPSNPSLKERPQMCEASNDFSRLVVPLLLGSFPELIGGRKGRPVFCGLLRQAGALDTPGEPGSWRAAEWAKKQSVQQPFLPGIGTWRGWTSETIADGCADPVWENVLHSVLEPPCHNRGCLLGGRPVGR